MRVVHQDAERLWSEHAAAVDAVAGDDGAHASNAEASTENVGLCLLEIEPWKIESTSYAPLTVGVNATTREYANETRGPVLRRDYQVNLHRSKLAADGNPPARPSPRP